MVSFTSDLPVQLKQHVGNDRMICDAARVSTLGSEEREFSAERDAGLIRFLMRSKHGSPFEHGSLTFIVTAPLFVFWDHVRHRIGVSYNLESSRYRQLEPVFFRAETSRVQSGKPGHYVMSPGSEAQTAVMHASRELVALVAWKEYLAQLDAGIAREQAMEVLPVDVVFTAYVTFNPRSLMHFLELRLGPAREEMQRVATSYAEIFAEYWPETHAAFEEFGRVAP